MLSYTNAIIVLGVLVGVIILGSAVIGLTTVPQQEFEHTEDNFQEFKSVELEDKCATPPGYDETSWRTHMSHHPDQYEGCL